MVRLQREKRLQKWDIGKTTRATHKKYLSHLLNLVSSNVILSLLHFLHHLLMAAVSCSFVESVSNEEEEVESRYSDGSCSVDGIGGPPQVAECQGGLLILIGLDDEGIAVDAPERSGHSVKRGHGRLVL